MLDAKLCFDFMYNFNRKASFSEKNSAMNLSRRQLRFHAEWLIFLFDFNQTLSLDFSTKSSSKNFMKIFPMGAELMHAVRRMDIKLTAAFRNFPNTSKMYVVVECEVL